ILAIGPENWDVQKILDSQISHLVTSDSELAIGVYLDLIFSRYLSNQDMIVNNDISAFSRSSTAEQYVRLIKAL
ncbi:hypothetical protein OAQ24_00550, partial [Flavobacteriaceae bacterium]|nr:hypothetical protein [Flavobacteriaceae bacterium]